MSEAKYPGFAPEVDPEIAGLAQAIATEPTGDALRERVWSAMAKDTVTNPGSSWLSPGRRWVMGSLIAATAFTGFSFLSIPGKPSHAFSEVERSMANFKTVMWRETVYVPDSLDDNRTQREGFVRTIWARLNSPAYAVISQWNRTVAFTNETYQIRGKRDNLVYSRISRGIPAFGSMGAKQDQSPEDRIRTIVLFPKPPTTGLDLWLGEGVDYKTHSPYRRSPWSSGITTLNGKRVIRFDSVVTYNYQDMHGVRGGGAPKSQTVYHKDSWSYWVEPDTYRIVRREVRLQWQAGNKTGISRVISAGFRYNLVPTPDVFNVAPRVGTRFSYVPLAQREATSEEQSEIEHLLRLAEEAWNRGDTEAYSACWDFDHILGAESEKQRLAEREIQLMRARIPFKEWRILTVSKAQTRVGGTFTYLPDKVTFPPKESNEFIVMVTAQVTETDGRNRTVPFLVNLRRGDDGFRLIRNFLDNAARFSPETTGKPSGTQKRPADRR